MYYIKKRHEADYFILLGTLQSVLYLHLLLLSQQKSKQNRTASFSWLGFSCSLTFHDAPTDKCMYVFHKLFPLSLVSLSTLPLTLLPGFPLLFIFLDSSSTSLTALSFNVLHVDSWFLQPVLFFCTWVLCKQRKSDARHLFCMVG